MFQIQYIRLHLMFLGSADPSFLRSCLEINNLIKNHKHITHTKLSHLRSLYSLVSLLWSLSVSPYNSVFACFSNGFRSLFSLL